MSSYFKTFFNFGFLFFLPALVCAGPLCTPFKVHTSSELPPPPQIKIPVPLPEQWEAALSERIGKVKTQEAFPRLYKMWLATHRTGMSDSRRYEWLRCLEYYTALDSNQNGVPDWSALVDQRPARVLYPADADQDGDGMTNVLDAEPLAANVTVTKNEIPAHLKFNAQLRPEAAALQEKIFKEFNLLAIDHTDQHSPAVLGALLELLQKGFPKKFITSLKGLKYIYAFAGHHPDHNVAAYHLEAQAISVGGVLAYPGAISGPLLSSLAHEIGHVVLLEKLSARELADISTKFSGWSAVDNSELNDRFYSPVLFQAFPVKDATIKAATGLVSDYAHTNRHEWFAETFADAVMKEMNSRSPAKTAFDKWTATLLAGSSSR